MHYLTFLHSMDDSHNYFGYFICGGRKRAAAKSAAERLDLEKNANWFF